MDSALDREPRTMEIGRELFRRANSGTAEGWLDRTVMKAAMRDGAVKGQLFRFVDALPALRGSGQVTGHLREYLQTVQERLPPAAQMGLHWWPTEGWGREMLANVVGWGARRMARRFIAGSDFPQVAGVIKQLRQRGMGFTLDWLGEAVVCESEADAYQQKYMQLLDQLAGVSGANLSLKLSSLYSQFDALDCEGTRESVARRLRPILQKARQSKVFINVDMEQWAFKEMTLEIFKSVLTEPPFADWAEVGIAIQGYLKSTLNDLQQLANWARRRPNGVWVRLVKGAYWDFEMAVAQQNEWEIPVFEHKPATDANFEACTEFLISQFPVLRPAIASHNIRSIAAAMSAAEAAGLAPGDVEFQMLFGMAGQIKTAVAAMGRPLRIYMPVGKLLPGMAYLVRRLLENTSNDGFLRAGFVQRVGQERLLMKPMVDLDISAKKQTGFANEPLLDFSIAATRQAMAAAVKQVLNSPALDCPAIVGGKPITNNRWGESINPSHHRQVVGRWASADESMARQAVASAKEAFISWQLEPAGRRAQLLERVADILHRDRLELASLEVAECGKPCREADADVCEAIDFCRYYAGQIRLLDQTTGRDLRGEENRWLHSPRGVAVIIAPWNFPLAILCGMTAAAVVCGNTAIMKPAEQSALTAAKLMAAFEEAGAPPGVVNYLPGIGEEIGPVLVAHEHVAVIAFTGSRAVGLAINQTANRTTAGQSMVKRVIAEMGGKNAIIVDSDADLDDAVTGVVASAFGYAGQKCSACSRVVVLEPIREEFVNRLIEATASLKITPAEDPACRIGPVIDAQAQQRIQATIERGKAHARLVYQANVTSLANEGFFVAPAIFNDVNPSGPLAQEEIFGPVLSVIPAKNLDQALHIANGVKYALTGGIYSRSPVNLDRCKHEFLVGNLYVNRKITGALVGRQPFGGFKLSGLGTQSGGPGYLQQFMWQRCITENTMRHGFVPD